MISKRFLCEFCGHPFTRRAWFEKHLCEKKKRFNQRHNMDVVRGYKLFNHWSKRQGFLRKGKERTYEEFIKSPYYNTFVKLVEFSNQTYVISVFRYLDWIIDHAISESDWTKPDSVASYRKYVRKNDDPIGQTETSWKNIMGWCEENKVPVRDFFSTVTPGNALNWIVLNRLSPWVLFGYDQAVLGLLRRFDDEKFHILDEHINTSYWLDRVKDCPTDREAVQKRCEELFGGS